jgi:hypothetical protein
MEVRRLLYQVCRVCAQCVGGGGMRGDAGRGADTVVQCIRCSQGGEQSGTHLHLLVQVVAQDKVMGHAHPVGLWQWEAGGRRQAWQVHVTALFTSWRRSRSSRSSKPCGCPCLLGVMMMQRNADSMHGHHLLTQLRQRAWQEQH